MQSSLTTHNPRLGYLYAVGAAVFWGLSGSAAKFLFNSGVSPFQLVQLRICITVVGLLIWLLIKDPRLLRIDRKDIFYLATLGTFGMAGVQFTYLFAVSKIHVAAAALLQYMAPLFITLHAVVFARDRLKTATIIALAAATRGCYLVVGGYNLNIVSLNLAGIISGLLSAVTFAWYSIHGEYGMRRYNPRTVLFYAMFFAAIVWNILHPPLEAFFHPYRMIEWGWILYIGIMGTLVPFGLYLQAVNLIRSTRASITATLEPITAGIVSWIFIGETMAPLQVAGGVLVIASIILLQLKQETDANTPALMRARAADERS